MNNNKNTKAAFFIGKLSTYGFAKPYNLHELTSHFMLKHIAILLFFVTTFSISAQGSCDFSSNSSGDLCVDAQFICGNELDGTVGTLPEPGSVIPDFPNVCDGVGTIENALWYAFIPCESTVTITICPSNCQPGMTFTGMQGAIYSNCDSSFSCITSLSVGTENCFTLTDSNFLPGFTYYLMLDGYGGSVCDFEITVEEGLNMDEFDLSINGTNEISGEVDACVEEGEVFTYSVLDCDVTATGCFFPGLSAYDLACYEWTITPSTVTYQGSTDEQIISVIFDEPGDYTISVERFLHPYITNCSTGSCDDPQDLVVEIKFLDTINNGTTIICPGEMALICGNPIGIPGVYECLDEDLCIVTIDTLEFSTDENQNLGNIFLCPGECFTLEGEEYCDRIDYEIESTDDCAITYQFSLKDLSIIITEPTTYPHLDCNTTSVFVSETIQTNYEGTLDFVYRDADGTIISNTNFAEITEPGDYTFYAFSLNNLPGCIDSVSFTIEEETEGPEISLDAEIITCSDKQAQLTVNEIDNVVSFMWTGVQVGNPSSTTAFASQPGLYIVSAEGDNGCLTIDSIEVEEVLLPAEIDVEWNDLDCKVAQSTLKYISDVTIDSVLWQGPFDFMSRQNEIVVTNTGMYALNLFASNGCDYTEFFEILGNFQDPEYTQVQPEEWACETETLQIEVAYGDTSNFEFSWFTDEGIIESNNINEDIIEVGSTGQYYVEITDVETGCSVIDTVEVFPNDEIPTAVELEKESPLCYDVNDGRIMIGEVTGGTAPFDYFIDNKVVSDLTIENLAPAIYEITIVDDMGCELKRMVEIEQPEELIGDIEGPTQANYNDVVTFTADVDLTQFDVDIINWYNSEAELIGVGEDISFTMEKDEVITMEIIDTNGCIVIKTRSLTLDEDYDYFLPNIFTPNGDGVNDFFGIFPQDLPGRIVEFQIYDRWGNKMFTLSNVDYELLQQNWGWDGSFNGSPVNSGVYVFYALAETLGVQKELKGSVTLVR